MGEARRESIIGLGLGWGPGRAASTRSCVRKMVGVFMLYEDGDGTGTREQGVWGSRA